MWRENSDAVDDRPAVDCTTDGRTASCAGDGPCTLHRVCVCVCVCAMRHQSISGACPPCPVSAYVHCPPLSPSIQRCPRRPSHHAVHPDSTVRPSVRRAYVFVSREERDRRLTRRLIVASVVDVVLVFVRFIWSLFDQRCFLQSSERVRVFFHNHKRNNEK